MNSKKRLIKDCWDFGNKLKSEDQVRNMSIRKNETNSWECRVLVSAGDEKVLEKHLVERNIDPNVRFRNETLIATAIKLRLPNIVKVLLRYGANPNLRSFENGRNEPPLITATRWKSIEIVKLLIKSGANLHATEFYGFDAAFQSVVENADDILTVILERIPAQTFSHRHQNCPFVVALKYSEKSANKRKCLLTLIRHNYVCECFTKEFTQISLPQLLAENQDKASTSAKIIQALSCSDLSMQVLVKEKNVSLLNLTRVAIRHYTFEQASIKQIPFSSAIHSFSIPPNLKDAIMYKDIKEIQISVSSVNNPERINSLVRVYTIAF